MFFFHFVSQEELIVSKVIFLPYSKLIVRVSYLFAFFFLNFGKWSKQIISQRDVRGIK